MSNGTSLTSLHGSYEFDLYLAHASEDKPFVRQLASEMAKRGWRVWLDEVEMIVGLTLRQQMDDGLAKSRFVAVVISRNFFLKRWPVRELDAAFQLENDGSTRVLPVWLGVDENEVRTFSAIVASISAVSTDGTDAEQVANKLDSSMDKLLDTAGELIWSDFIRQDIREGLLWVRPPQLYPKSLALIDTLREFFWGGRESAVILGPLVSDLPLEKVFEEPSRYEGKLIRTVGWQGQQQLLTFGDRVIYQYVVQLKSGQSGYQTHLMYVLLAERSSGEPLVPHCPPGHTTEVLGAIVARGALQVSDGLFTAIYLVAARLRFLPVRPMPTLQ